MDWKFGERKVKRMKNKKKVILGICSGIVLFVLTLMVYTVDTTEYVVVTQFGNPVRVIEDAGLQIKLPDPIQSVRRLDKRVQIYQADELELLSSDKKNVSLDYYGTWKIVDPVKYMKTVKDEIGAQSRLRDVFSSSIGVQLSQYSLEELVNINEDELKLDSMLAEATNYAREKAAEYGIEIVDTQIRVLNFPEANKQSVYDRMKAEREQMAKQYRAEGSEEAAKIRAEAEKEQTTILSEAYKQAQEIKGEGNAEAIRIYGEAFGKDPQFYEFVRTLETYEKTIDDNTTLILPSTAEILKYLSGDGISENRTNVAE